LYTDAYFSERHVQEDHSTSAVEREIGLRLETARGLMEEASSPCRWLDIGCASGYLIAAGSRLGCEVEGIEISEWAATFAAGTLGLRVFGGTLSEFSKVSDGRRYGLITAMAYLEHSATPLEDLVSIADLLSPAGVFVVRLPNRSGFDRYWHGDLWHGWHLPYHLYHFTPASLRRLIERVGLVPYRIDTGFWNPLVHLREALRGDGIRADHPFEGRPRDLEIQPSPVAVANPRPSSLTGRVKPYLAPIFSGRDMIVYARK
jgi:SAM-dependent methyltransferase